MMTFSVRFSMFMALSSSSQGSTIPTVYGLIGRNANSPGPDEPRMVSSLGCSGHDKALSHPDCLRDP
jgi:hypothetical protein